VFAALIEDFEVAGVDQVETAVGKHHGLAAAEAGQRGGQGRRG
jgi:hypothetical protein